MTRSVLLPHLAAASTGTSGGSKLFGFVVFVVLALGLFLLIRWVRPKVREQRHRAWESAGLLPEQVDPDRPRTEEGSESRPDGESQRR
ncbi:hypothetical protein PZ938_15625 [Luteipulveratus sp. YIM 133132]|uniref:Uncharacterized protein n=1 Tax=Luteipulveratus flavus TaxID=3031728 RepID=A0ABT6C311_9MICO|nr:MULTISPECIES: hypothetical protein [unclassified Luteipulveratus]MDE9367046.1 hypothetical protein [Luteipulveratus sp. YIM 133132]MDF8263031.1 hypothetical protein [Luteipulveratus sp. YIM 133296]